MGPGAVFVVFVGATAGVVALVWRQNAQGGTRGKGEKKLPSTKEKDKRHILSKRLPNRHKVIKGAFSEDRIRSIWTDIKKVFSVQDGVMYKGQDWKISSYMELDPTGHISGRHKVSPHIPLLHVCAPLMGACDEMFEKWYSACYGCKYVKAERLHSFVTRYEAKPGFDQLRKHIDGRHLDGSAIIRLPGEFGCEGGDLKVWDGKNPVVCQTYKMDSGDVCLLDRAVWHQALPVTSGVKWCIVIFYKAYRSKAAALAAKSARPESLSLLAVTDE